MDLYHPHILRHNSEPIGFSKMENASYVIEAYNPICGDQFDLFLRIENDVIEDASFYGYGCAVSKASTSMLIDRIKGLTMLKGVQLVNNVLKRLKEEEASQFLDEELQALVIAKKYPGRMKCAMLSWDAFQVDM